jgi:hypothetical protein
MLYSIQFVSENSAEYHYMNFEFDDSEQDGAILERIAVADLPLQSANSWRVLKFMPNGASKEIGKIYGDAYGLWHYLPCATHVREDCLNIDEAGFRPKFVLVSGPPKSGTTWVERILNSHPNALATGENEFFRWPDPRDLHHLMLTSPPPYFSKGVQQRPPFRSQVALLLAGRAEKTLKQIAEIARVEVVADKTPKYWEHLPEIFSLFPGWKYVHCVRNPLDVMVSRFFHERQLLLNSPELSLLPKDERIRSSVIGFTKGSEKGYMFENLADMDWFIDASIEGHIVFHMAAEYKNIHIVRYEGLLSDFSPTVARLFDFLGLTTDYDTILEIQNRNRFEKYSGGRKPGEEDEHSFFRKGIVRDHLNYMTKEQIDYAIGRIIIQSDWYRSYFGHDQHNKTRIIASTV